MDRALWSGSNHLLSLIESLIPVTEVSPDDFWLFFTEEVTQIGIGLTLICRDVDDHCVLGTITTVSLFRRFIAWEKSD